MRSTLQSGGFLLIVAGISGTIDHIWTQPVMGRFLNVLERQVFPRVPVLDGLEIYANLAVAVLGLIILVAADHRSGAS